MKIVIHPSDIEVSGLVSLYTECFSTGLSEQYIDTDALQIYLRSFIENGKIIALYDQNELSGALLAIPVSFDTVFPEELKSQFVNKNVWYIAEMMVSEQHRSKGWGRKLLDIFFQEAKQWNIKDVFIRVWDRNTAALTLYRKTGFSDMAEISQTKTKADLSGDFIMKKIYLHKKI